MTAHTARTLHMRELVLLVEHATILAYAPHGLVYDAVADRASDRADRTAIDGDHGARDVGGGGG